MTEIIQGSLEWHALRCGKVTASRVADIIATTKSGPAASRANYMAELIAERLTGTNAESYVNADMQWGTDHEPQARMAYEFMKDAEVVQVGFVDHPMIAMSGASPDGLIGDDGLIEIKCPKTATHLDTLLTGSIPGKYNTQMQWQMICTDRKWCDFVSYDPRMPESMKLFIKRVERDSGLGLEQAVIAFIAEMEQKIEALKLKYE